LLIIKTLVCGDPLRHNFLLGKEKVQKYVYLSNHEI